MRTVVFYDTADVTMEQMMEVYPRHDAFEKEFVKTGKVLGIGPFSNPGEGAMAIFSDREAAEYFVKNDPFVQEGIVAKVTIKDWVDDLE